MIFAGIDIGAVNIALVIIDREKELLEQVSPSGIDGGDPLRSMNTALEKTRLKWEQIKAVVATGRGRSGCPFADNSSTEVVCQARGVAYLFPSARAIIHLGAETSRVIGLNDSGRAVTFATNDKCAAGSGLFLDSMADLMRIPISEMGPLALKAESVEEVSSRCAVFAESEVISHIHRGVPRESILAGLHLAVADRIMDLIQKVTIKADVIITGGVARNPAIIKEIENKLGRKLYVPPNPQIIGALGAALQAQDRFNS